MDVFLVISICLNLIFGFLIVMFYYRFKKIRDKFNKRPDSYDVTELMHDLMSNNAIIEVRRVDPRSIFKRSVI